VCGERRGSEIKLAQRILSRSADARTIHRATYGTGYGFVRIAHCLFSVQVLCFVYVNPSAVLSSFSFVLFFTLVFVFCFSFFSFVFIFPSSRYFLSFVLLSKQLLYFAAFFSYISMYSV